MGFGNVNLIAVASAALAAWIIGAIWYSPMLFGKLWMKLSGIKPGKGAILSLFLGFLSILVTSYVLAIFVDYTYARSALEAISMGFFVWLGFIATTTLGMVIYEKKPVSLYVLNNAYNLISVVVMAIILASWP